MYCDWPVLGRCCFCMPLRRGVLTFGYLNLIFSAFMVGVYSYAVHGDYELSSIYHGITIRSASSVPEGLCVFIYCLEIVFSAILLYGTHMKLILYIKTYYYFAVTTTVASVLVQIIYFAASAFKYIGFHFIFEILPLMFAGLAIQIYLILLLRSLLKKMEEAPPPSGFENQLQQIVYEGKVEANGVYDSTVVPVGTDI